MQSPERHRLFPEDSSEHLHWALTGMGPTLLCTVERE